MSVDIPQPFKTKVVSPVTIDGIPDTFHINVDHLPTIVLNVEHLPAIHLSVDHIPKIQLGVDPVEIRLTEFPSIRGHLPADFCIGLSVMGMDLMNVRLCGEAQIITEPYQPNPCETCGVQRPAPDVPGSPEVGREVGKAAQVTGT
ncbi:MAG: hypothetical protein ACRELX_02015 [Longimicrobiales bacterium]